MARLILESMNELCCYTFRSYESWDQSKVEQVLSIHEPELVFRYHDHIFFAQEW